jgi:glycosyltransferase involved in cell wall biosynthesis
MRHFHNRADATLVPTHELADLLRSQGFQQVRRLPRAVDCDRFSPDRRDPALRAQWGAGPDDPVALHVGRIAPEKNLDLAVRAYRRLQQAHPRARFVWVGDGPERTRLQREHPDFIFCGVQHGNDLARHFASGDLFLFPSHSETFGNVTLEAMASGVPPVAFDYGAAREHLRDGLHGAAIDDGDDEGFIAAAVDIGGDAQRRAGMALRGREAVMRLQPQQVARDFDALLRDLVAGRKDESIALASTSGRR